MKEKSKHNSIAKPSSKPNGSFLLCSGGCAPACVAGTACGRQVDLTLRKDTKGLVECLDRMADEARDANDRIPRGTAMARDERGNTLLALAAWHGAAAIAAELLTHASKLPAPDPVYDGRCGSSIYISL